MFGMLVKIIVLYKRNIILWFENLADVLLSSTTGLQLKPMWNSNQDSRKFVQNVSTYTVLQTD